VLIPFLYAISLRVRSQRLVRVPSDKNTRWWLSFPRFTDKRQEFLVSLIFQLHSKSGHITATLHHVRQNDDSTRDPLWTKLCLFLILCFIVGFVCLFINMNFLYLLTCFKFYTYLMMYCIELSHASHVSNFQAHTSFWIRWGINDMPYDYWSRFRCVKHPTHIWVSAW
jgi:hypothetical protein